MWRTFVVFLQLENGTLRIVTSLHHNNIQYRQHETIYRIKIYGDAFNKAEQQPIAYAFLYMIV